MKHASVQNALLVLVLLSSLLLNVRTWTGWGAPARTNDRGLQDATRNVEQLAKAVADLSATVAQLQSANDQLVQAAVRGGARSTDVEPRLRAIEANLTEQTMMFRRLLEQYRRP
jgi:outer membrane murein-binding lipoprotein Lpp